MMKFILRLVLRLAVMLLPAAARARYLARPTVRKPSSVSVRASEPLRILALYESRYRNRDVMNPAPGSRFERAKQELSKFYGRVLQS